jgi:methyl-accepting chemotaxis protein
METNFDQMLLAHSRWKAKLKAAIEQREAFDARIAGKDDQCEMGKWIYGEGNKYAARALFLDLKAKHAKFHACVANVLVQIRSSSPAKALELIDPQHSEYGRASSDCINAIAALRDSLKASPVNARP